MIIQKQKEVLWDVQSEFIRSKVPSTSTEVKEMPKRFQGIFQKKVPPKVSKLRTFLSNCLTLMKDKYAIAELQAMIEEIPVEPRTEKKVNQVRKNVKLDTS